MLHYGVLYFKNTYVYKMPQKTYLYLLLAVLSCKRNENMKLKMKLLG